MIVNGILTLTSPHFATRKVRTMVKKGGGELPLRGHMSVDRLGYFESPGEGVVDLWRYITFNLCRPR